MKRGRINFPEYISNHTGQKSNSKEMFKSSVNLSVQPLSYSNGFPSFIVGCIGVWDGMRVIIATCLTYLVVEKKSAEI